MKACDEWIQQGSHIQVTGDAIESIIINISAKIFGGGDSDGVVEVLGP